jgi:hypothetical protein
LRHKEYKKYPKTTAKNISAAVLLRLRTLVI